MLKQLIDVKSNKIFVLQTTGKGTSCPACVWQTDLHTDTAAVCEPALSLLHTTAAIYLYGSNILTGPQGVELSWKHCNFFAHFTFIWDAYFTNGIGLFYGAADAVNHGF